MEERRVLVSEHTFECKVGGKIFTFDKRLGDYNAYHFMHEVMSSEMFEFHLDNCLSYFTVYVNETYDNDKVYVYVQHTSFLEEFGDCIILYKNEYRDFIRRNACHIDENEKLDWKKCGF